MHSLTSLNSNGRPRFLHPYHSPRIYLSRAYSRQQGYKRNRQGFHACHLDAWLPPPPRISMAPCPGKRSYVFLSKYRSLRYLVATARPSQAALCVHGKRGFLPLFFFSISLSSLSCLFLFGSTVYFSSFRALDNTCLLNFLFPRCPKFEPKHVRLFNSQ